MKRRALLAVGAIWPGCASAEAPALVRAADADDVAALRRLRGADVNAKDTMQDSPYLLAVARGGWRSCA